MGEGLTLQANEPVAYSALTYPDAQRPTLALGKSWIREVSSILVRDVHDTKTGGLG
jgi:hypothetical protein